MRSGADAGPYQPTLVYSRSRDQSGADLSGFAIRNSEAAAEGPYLWGETWDNVPEIRLPIYPHENLEENHQESTRDEVHFTSSFDHCLRPITPSILVTASQ
jgi:hypothetical protein